MQQSDTEQIFARVGRILRRRKLLMLVCLVTVLVPIGIFNEVQTPIYQASTTVVFDEFANPVSSVDADYSREILIANRLEEFGSYSFAKDIADALPEESLQRFPYPEDAPDGFDEKAFAVSKIHKSIEAYSVRNSNIVRVHVQMEDRELCAAVANTAARVFQERSYRIKQEGTSGVRRFIESQLAIFETKLNESEESLKRYKQTNKVVSFESEAQEILKRATEAEVLYNQAKTNRRSLEERMSAVEAEIARQKKVLVPSMMHVSTPWAQKLKANLVDLQTQYMELKVQNYPPTHPKMVQLETEIERTKVDLGAEALKLAEAQNVVDPIVQMEKYFIESSSLQIEIESLRAQEAALKRVIDEYDISLGTLPDKELNLAQLERDRNVNQKLYTNLLEKLEATKISEAEKIPSIRIIDEAKIPSKPIRPRKKLNVAIGILFALFAGVGLAWFQEAVVAPVGSVQALENLTGWSVLASVPRIEKLPRGKLKLEHQPRSRAQVRRIKRHIYSQIEPYSAAAEAYRMLRTNLQFIGLGEKHRTILVTSIGPSEGKSTTLSNLAISLAKLGQKTLVLDSEVRRPVQHTAFDMTRGPGLAEVLVTSNTEVTSNGNGKANAESNGEEDIDEVWIDQKRKKSVPIEISARMKEDAAHPKRLDELLKESVRSVRIRNLNILTSGDRWMDPSVTVSNYAQRLKAILSQLKQRHDVILVDAPPLMLVHDAAVVSTMVDGVIFVVNSSRVDDEALLKAKQLLENANANVLGIVLNDFETTGVYGSYYTYYRELENTQSEAASAA